MIQDDGHRIAGLSLASRWRRLAAAIVDNLVSIACSTPIIIHLDLMSELVEVSGQPALSGAKLAAVIYAVWLAVNAWPLHHRAQSLGKLALGIMIVDGQGRPAPLLRIAVDRTLSVQMLALIPYVGGAIAMADVLLIFRADRRCMHDLIARTHVVERPPHFAARIG